MRRLMLQPVCTNLALASLLAVASGFALNLHLHDGSHDDGNLHHSCDLCHQLTHVSAATASTQSPVISLGDASALRGVAPADLPETEARYVVAIPRAPPLAA